MKHPQQIIEEVRNESSTNGKIAILERNRDNKSLQQLIHLTYNKHIQYHIKQIPDYTPIRTSAYVSLDQIMMKLENLSSRRFTGNKARNYLQELLESAYPEDAELIELLIGRDLKCGASAKTFNKVWPDLVPMFDPMACQPFNEKHKKHIKFPAYCQEKLDGMRNVVIFGENNSYEIRTRNGLYFDDLGAFQNLRNALFYNNIVLDGEFMIRNEDGTYMTRRKGNGICNKAIKGTLSQKEADSMVFVVWDILTGNEFKNGGGRSTKERFERLQEVYGTRLRSLDNVELVKYEIVNSEAEIQTHFEALTSRGGEGVVVKNYDQQWENKRSHGWQKLKLENFMELEVEEVWEGMGKYKGSLGTLKCKDATGRLKCGIGGGIAGSMDDEERQHIWDKYLANPEDIVGKIITVRYAELMPNHEQGTANIHIPKYVEFRLDKDNADDVTELIT